MYIFRLLDASKVFDIVMHFLNILYLSLHRNTIIDHFIQLQEIYNKTVDTHGFWTF